jgi:glyoxylase-like metal-dependent hydrolase (beta-lactamase superfamily II)
MLVMRIATAAAPPFYKNGFVVSCEDTREAVLIDPGDEVESLLRAIRDAHLLVQAILLTHAHLDHVSGVARGQNALAVPVWLHRDDLFLYNGAWRGHMFGLRVEPPPPVDPLPGRRALPLSNYVVTSSTRPGTAQAACARSAAGRRRGSSSATRSSRDDRPHSLPGGDMPTLLHSISVLFAFPDDTVVHSGHSGHHDWARARPTRSSAKQLDEAAERGRAGSPGSLGRA